MVSQFRYEIDFLHDLFFTVQEYFFPFDEIAIILSDDEPVPFVEFTKLAVIVSERFI
jgi:hypothetical protein